MEQPLKNSLSIAEIKELNLLERINAICEDLEPIRKDVQIKIGNGGYSAISHDNVTASISELMCKYRVASIPNELSKTIVSSDRGIMVEVTMQMQFVSLDDMNEQVSVQMSALGTDSQDKAYGKAQSMATKYCYLKMFRMQTLSNEESRKQPNGGLQDPPKRNNLASANQLKVFKNNTNNLTKQEIEKVANNTLTFDEAKAIFDRWNAMRGN